MKPEIRLKDLLTVDQTNRSYDYESLEEETWENGYERRVIKVTNAEHKQQGHLWRIKGKDDASKTIKYYKTKPDFEEFVKQMKRVAGHEFGG